MNSQTLANELDKTLAFLDQELGQIRDGRANTSLVDSLKVPVYGQQLPLNQTSNISVPDSQTIFIEPWDKSNLEAIEKAISENNTLGINPSSDGNRIILKIPAMTEEVRVGLVKLISEKQEQALVALRQQRQTAHKSIKTQEKDKLISEDQASDLKDQIEKTCQDYTTKIKQMIEVKQTAIKSI
ncbi:ribosome recycling factor [Candidatus Saccharibacteria bacterium]|nr:ribosome recycling factor [Candidatus Saccharibacteria bacterium]MCB9834877.1 ribosome recycling factor [Candidatus Nomurabacteria bacterium]